MAEVFGLHLMGFVPLLFFVLFLLLFILVVEIPYKIARSRRMSASDQSWIRILSWLGIFFGLTWILALLWALFGTGDVRVDPYVRRQRSQMDILLKLHALREKGVLSEEEYERKKQEILKKM